MDHMASWRIMRGETQLSCASLSELVEWARRGDLAGGDMVQPPGTVDWLYASEIEEVRAVLGPEADDGDDFDPPKKSALPVIGGLGAVLALGLLAMAFFGSQLGGTGGRLIGGPGGLSLSQMVVTEPDAALRMDPVADGRAIMQLTKDSTLELLAKRGDFYRARTEGGQEGWVSWDHVIPMYQLGGADVREKFDPLYNPDDYVDVLGGSWAPVPDGDPDAGDVRTSFDFGLSNRSSYVMTDLVIRATIKDPKGHVLEEVEFAIEGELPAESRTSCGTLAPADEDGDARVLTAHTFAELSKGEPDLSLRWTPGVTARMQSTSFVNAEINIVELRAIPDEEATTVVRRR